MQIHKTAMLKLAGSLLTKLAMTTLQIKSNPPTIPEGLVIADRFIM